MAASGKRVVLFISIAFAMVGGIHCVYFSASAMTYAIPEIYSLLENVTGTANEAVQFFEKQLVKQQENHEQTMVSYQNQLEKQDQLLNVLQYQQDNNTGIINVLQTIVNQITTSQQEKENQVINYLHQGQQNSLKTQQDNHHEVATLLQNQQQTLTRIAETQSQVAESHARMANAFQQVVSLLQTQNQQLQNVTDAMNTVVSVMENQQETLENISRLLPAILKQQANHTELLSQCQPIPECPDVESNNRFQTTQATIITTNPTTMTSAERVTQDTATLRSVESPIHDCSELVANGRYPSSVYTITPTNGVSFDVYCDMDTADGGWTVLQKRFNGSVNFYRGWDEYEHGFGDLNSEFWLGLRKLHQLTQSGSWALRIDLEDFEGNRAYAIYNSFHIGDVASNYTLSIGSYQGTAGDSMAGIDSLNNMQFTTYDKDNDIWRGNCADNDNRQGAWWHRRCTWSNLNGQYLGPSRNSWTGMMWYHWKNSTQSLKKSEMKIRPVQ